MENLWLRFKELEEKMRQRAEDLKEGVPGDELVGFADELAQLAQAVASAL